MGCLNIKTLRQEKLQTMVDHYDWGKMVTVYDDVFENIKSACQELAFL